VIAVNLHKNILIRNFPDNVAPQSIENMFFLNLMSPLIPKSILETASSLTEFIQAKFWPVKKPVDERAQQSLETVHPPHMFKILTTAIDIMQNRIITCRLASDPPEVELAPKTSLDTFDFHKAAEAIQAGKLAVYERLSDIKLAIANNTQKAK